jgi:hypothetical protein
MPRVEARWEAKSVNVGANAATMMVAAASVVRASRTLVVFAEAGDAKVAGNANIPDSPLQIA